MAKFFALFFGGLAGLIAGVAGGWIFRGSTEWMRMSAGAVAGGIFGGIIGNIASQMSREGKDRSVLPVVFAAALLGALGGWKHEVFLGLLEPVRRLIRV